MSSPVGANPYYPQGAGEPRPTGPLHYGELLRGAPRTGWWALLGVVAVLLGILVLQALALVPTSVYYLTQGYSVSETGDRLTGNPATPGFLLAVNLGWLLAIAAVWFAVRVVHGLKPALGWATSVVGRFRWRWFGACLGLAFVALVATLLVSLVVPADDSSSTAGALNAFTSETRDYLIVIVLLTPFQAAGEEYVFRGYLMQVFGVLPWRRIATYAAIVLSALVFALAHGAGQGWPVFIDRFAFGLVAAYLVVRTGGLEAGIAMHVLNNWFAFGLALAFGDMTESLNASGGSWWQILVTATQSLVFVSLVLWVARRMGMEDRTTGDPTELVGQRGRV